METVSRLATIIRDYSLLKSKQDGLFVDMEKWSRERSQQTGKEVLLERHKMSHLFKNERLSELSISFPLLNCLCEYLIERHHVPRKLLPQHLFGAKEQHLFELIGSTRNLRFFAGMRSAREWKPNSYVMSSDAQLQNKLGSLISQYVNSSPTGRNMPWGIPEMELVPAPMRDVTPTTRTKEWRQTCSIAENHFREFCDSEECATLIATGSIKVNGLVEQIIASIFSARAYEPPAKIRTARDRSVPIFFRYRGGKSDPRDAQRRAPEFRGDPQPPSCCGGVRLARNDKLNMPGIYYEKENGEWECAPCDDEHQDVGFLVFSQLPSRHVILACGGFSSRATQGLTRRFHELVDDFWPPQIDTDDLKVGVFLVKFDFSNAENAAYSETDNGSFLDLQKKPHVVRLDDYVIQRRLTPTATWHRTVSE